MSATATDGAPLLLTGSKGLHPTTATEIARVLQPRGRVVLLGGEAALSATVVDDIRATQAFLAARTPALTQYAGTILAPLLLTPTDRASIDVLDYVSRAAGSIAAGAVYGGRVAVADTVLADVAGAADLPAG